MAGDDLLTVMPVGSKTFKSGSTPVAMEFQVPPELHPYLVTAAGRSKFIWLPKSRQGKVRAAFREVGRSELYLDIVREVSLCGQSNDWQNVYEFSAVGVMKAIEHLRYYDISEVEILVGPAGLPDSTVFEGVKVTVADWLPTRMVVVVPKNRDFLGFVADLPKGRFISVVHNPSRAMAMAVGDEYR